MIPITVCEPTWVVCAGEEMREKIQKQKALMRERKAEEAARKSAGPTFFCF